MCAIVQSRFAFLSDYMKNAPSPALRGASISSAITRLSTTSSLDRSKSGSKTEGISCILHSLQREDHIYHTYIHTYIHTYVHTHTYIHTYIHRYMHACTQNLLLTHAYHIMSCHVMSYQIRSDHTSHTYLHT